MKKLVRDKIPEIMETQGKKVKLKVVKEKEFQKYLEKKLLEEVNEFFRANTRNEKTEELGDMLEILDALRDFHNLSEEEVLLEKENKAQQRGGFEKGYVVEF